jgi:AcrR family transcriptional regulator
MRAAEVTPRIGRPTEAEARIKRNQILAAAQSLFVELGYRAVTMRLVADKAQVSTRTLYNHYADKASLFAACLDFSSSAFPQLEPRPGLDVRRALRQYAAEVVRVLSTHASFRLGMLIYREGGDFPELVRASETHYERYLVQPLARFLHEVGLADNHAEEKARLFIIMALSEWQRGVIYQRPALKDAEIEHHARFAVTVFLDGVLSS